MQTPMNLDSSRIHPEPLKSVVTPKTRVGQASSQINHRVIVAVMLVSFTVTGALYRLFLLLATVCCDTCSFGVWGVKVYCSIYVS